MTARDAATTETASLNDDIVRKDADDLLDRRLNLGAAGWFGAFLAVTLLIAFALRFVTLGSLTLSPGESEWAYDAWSFYKGRPLPGGEDLPLAGPLFLILEAIIFFLFGVSDATARAGPALVGIATVGLITGFRPFLPRSSVAGMMLLAALSPTLVFASRTVDPVILVAFLSLASILAVLRAGRSGSRHRSGWAVALGVSIGGMLAAGPEGLSAIMTIVIALTVAGTSDAAGGEDGTRGPVAAGLTAAFGTTRAGLMVVVGFAATVLLCFTRLFSDFSALQGVLTTFRDWARLLATQSSQTPTQFFLYAVVLYELLAVAFAIVAVASTPDHDDPDRVALRPTLFVAWFVAALVLQSFSSGRHPDQTLLVSLPLMLLGGIGLGRLGSRIPWRRLATSRAGLAPMAVFGIVVGLIAAITLVARGNDPGPAAGQGSSMMLQVAFILLLVVVPLGALLANDLMNARRVRHVGWSALLVLAVVLGMYTVRSTTQLSYVRADEGNEMLAPNVPTDGVRALVDQTLRLSRDLSLTEVSNVDNTGSYGISIAIDPALEWPLAWYFRDFPDVRVTTPAGWGDADMVIAPTPEGMEESGYIVRTRTWVNRTPVAYQELNPADVVSHLFSPSKWYDSVRYLLHRELPVPPAPDQISVGHTFRLSNQMNPSEGPFDLFSGQALGPGTGLGQLNGPTGIALSENGDTIYVVDAGNQRIQRFARDGSFIGVWGAETDPRLALAFSADNNQGASDIVVGDDGLIYVADTWNHRLLVIDSGGQVVREIGRNGELTDTGNSPDPGTQTGLFFGPRGVALANDEIFVTDTGNERVQVFAPDGTFLRAFGGYGSEPGQLLEPVGIAIGPDNNVYVADSGNARLSVFAKDGTPLWQTPIPSWVNQGELVNFLKFGPDGVLFMTSPGVQVVEAFQNGEIVEVTGYAADRGVSSPAGITVAPDGSVLLTDTRNSAVEEFEPVLPEGFGESPDTRTAGTPGTPALATPAR